MFRFALAVSLLIPALPAVAQPPARPHADLPTADQPVRRVPTTGYTLAISWGPEVCRPARAGGADRCLPAARAGFTLHGLWPDGDGPNRWPQYCRPVAILTGAEVRAGMAATPAPQLLQHEWAKHGSCMADTPRAYLAEEQRLYRAVRFPDMRALAARRDLTAAGFRAAFAAANPGMRADTVRLNVNRRGWLEEVWLCLDRSRRYAACTAAAGDGAATGPLRIARPA